MKEDQTKMASQGGKEINYEVEWKYQLKGKLGARLSQRRHLLGHLSIRGLSPRDP